MRPEVEAIEPWIVGKRQRQRRCLTVCFALPLKDVQDRLRMRCVVIEGFADGALELVGTVGGEHRAQSADVATERLLALGKALKKLLAEGDGVGEVVADASLVCPTLLLPEGPNMRGTLDLTVAIGRTRVRGDDIVAVEDPTPIEVRDDDELPADVRVRNRVVLEVEADVRCFAGVDLFAFVAWEADVGQGTQRLALALEGVSTMVEKRGYSMVRVRGSSVPRRSRIVRPPYPAYPP